MKKLVILFLVTFSLQAMAQDALNTVCPISGKPANPNITTVYEGKTFAFAEEACRKKFEADRAASLYQQLGGKAAIDAAVGLLVMLPGSRLQRRGTYMLEGKLAMVRTCRSHCDPSQASMP